MAHGAPGVTCQRPFRQSPAKVRAMRIVFLGTPDFTLPIIEACARAGELAMVVAQPDRPVGRSAKPQPPPPAKWPREHGLPLQQPQKAKKGRLAALLASPSPA